VLSTPGQLAQSNPDYNKFIKWYPSLGAFILGLRLIESQLETKEQ